MYETFELYFGDLDDPRQAGKIKHKLLDMLFMGVVSVLCNVESFVEMTEFIEDEKDWFSEYVSFENGIPSHDTFGRVFASFDLEKLSDNFFNWSQHLIDQRKEKTQLNQIAIDGKTVRGSNLKKNEKQHPLHVVGAFCSNLGLALGQVKVSDKAVKNEKKAILDVLDHLNLKGSIVTIDAAGSYKDIADKIIERKGDYCLPIKGNNRELLKIAREAFLETDLSCEESYELKENGHGRFDGRRCYFIKIRPSLKRQISWKKANYIGVYEKSNQEGDPILDDRRFYFVSRKLSPKEFLDIARNHWKIENNLHWVLDVTFREDDCRILQKKAAMVMTVVRRLVTNILKLHPIKRSMLRKRKYAMRSEEFRTELLENAFK